MKIVWEAQPVALDFTTQLGANFPFLRPTGADAVAFVERSADALYGVDGEVPDDVVACAAALLAAAERKALVAALADRTPETWARLSRRSGEDGAEKQVVEEAVRSAIDELREPPEEYLDRISALDFPQSPPSCTLVAVLAEYHVWSLDDAFAAARGAFGHGEHRDTWERAVDAVCAERLEPVHLARLRRIAARLASWLPLPARPRASRLLLRACRRLDDDDFVSEVAAELLRKYVVWLIGPPPFAR